MEQNKEITTTQVYNDVKTAISALSDNLKVGAEQLWKVLIKQQYIKGIFNLGFILLTTIVFWISYNILFYAIGLNLGVKFIDLDPLVIMGLFFLCVGNLIMIAISFQKTYEGITYIFNPEYGALIEISRFLPNNN